MKLRELLQIHAPGATINEGRGLSRRRFLRTGIGGTGLLGAAALGLAPFRGAPSRGGQEPNPPPESGYGNRGGGPHAEMMHPMPTVVGEVDHERNGFHPTRILTDFDAGTVSTLPDGQTLHEYTLVAQNRNIEIVPGLEFPAWTYNGRVPGPTIRVREGDRVRIRHRGRRSGQHPLPRRPPRERGRSLRCELRDRRQGR